MLKNVTECINRKFSVRFFYETNQCIFGFWMGKNLENGIKYSMVYLS